DLLPRARRVHQLPVAEDGSDTTAIDVALVTRELHAAGGQPLERLAIDAFDRLVDALELRAAARLFERGVVAGDVHAVAALQTDDLGQIQREAVGVVELEGVCTGEHLASLPIERREPLV